MNLIGHPAFWSYHQILEHQTRTNSSGRDWTFGFLAESVWCTPVRLAKNLAIPLLPLSHYTHYDLIVAASF